MIYRDYEIYARVWESTSDLYEMNDDGTLGESLDILIHNDDKHIVWYEVDFGGVEFFETLEQAKNAIDKSIEVFEKEYAHEIK